MRELRINQWLFHAKVIKLLPKLMLLGSCVCLIVAAYFAWLAITAYQANQALANKTLIKQVLQAHESQKAYNKGFLLAMQGQSQQSLKAFTDAEVTQNDALRARAKYAIGNHYYEMAMRSANIAAGGAHQQAVAQIELAREAYKGALRLNPDLHDAKFNLELLDRLSPEKRTQGWQAETDGVTLKPFKRNGTAMMRDNKRRGLP